jgi:uncharacterized membrane protein
MTEEADSLTEGAMPSRTFVVERSTGAKVAYWATVVIAGFIVGFHIFAFFLESVLLKTGLGRSLFKELVDHCSLLAANQGVYNLMLAFGNKNRC